MNDSFSALHPALTFCYFAAVLLLTMLVLHPVFLALSLLGALGYCAVLRGWRSLGRTLGWLVPFLVLMAALNALLNHAGVTMLFYLPNGNPVTREALCYGAAAAAMFAAVILWFQCCNVVMTAEKYLYVFGSALPGVSLLLSMAHVKVKWLWQNVQKKMDWMQSTIPSTRWQRTKQDTDVALLAC